MSESKYSPEVNMPEKVPGNAQNPEALTAIFLHNSGQWIGVDGKQLMLYQVEEGKIGLGYRVGDTFRSVVLFPGTLAPAEKTLVVP